jgi:DNA adenine methylase
MHTEKFGHSGKSFLSWVGGKARLADKIIPLIPGHTCYCEVFAGAAWLLFKKPESKSEVINDINVELVTLYRVVQHHLDEFMRYFRWVLVSREEFERLHRVEADTLTDIQRAARFYYMMRTGFSSKVGSTTFGMSTASRPALNLLRMEEDLSAAHLRLARVYIENMPFGALIERYDRPHTFFYVDPPYHGSEDDYGKGLFRREDFAVLAELLGRIKGRFIMSINDTPEIRKLYGRFHVRSVPTRYSVGHADRAVEVRELLVMNFKTERA